MAGRRRPRPAPALRRRGAAVAGGGGRAAALPRTFFARPTEAVARDLVGARLLCDPGTEDEVEAVIVEVEAYLGMEDPASHAHRGPTRRAAIMFGPPGWLYVYLSYGMHCCANIVTEPAPAAGAVLLRAAAVERGEATVRRRRSVPGGHVPPAADLLRGPGNLGRGLGLALTDGGTDLCARDSRLRVLERTAGVPLVVGPRVGISRAADRPLRFAWAGHPAVSRPWPRGAPAPLGEPRTGRRESRAGGGGDGGRGGGDHRRAGGGDGPGAKGRGRTLPAPP